MFNNCNPKSMRDVNVSQSPAHLNCDHTILFAVSLYNVLASIYNEGSHVRSSTNFRINSSRIKQF